MSIAALLLVSIAFATQVEAPVGLQVGKIDEAVAQLGSDRFTERQNAMERLWETGEAARPALERAAKSTDREVASRARAVLEHFRWGVYSSTPGDDLKLINLFRFGRLADKQLALQQLRDRGEVAAVMRLIEAEPSPAIRDQLTRRLFQELEKVVAHLLLEGEQDRAENLVQLAATNDAGIRHYAAFLLTAGRLDEAIPQLTDQWSASRDALAGRKLVFLHRAKGDLAAAVELAEQLNDEKLTSELCFEAGQWDRCVQLLRYENGKPRVFSTDIELLGRYAANCRLAGEFEEFERSMAEITQLYREKPDQIWYVIEALLLNDRWEDGLLLMKSYNAQAAVRLMIMQARFSDAFAFAGLQRDASDHAAWFDQAIQDAQSKDSQKRSRGLLAAQVARGLHLLGRRELAENHLRRLADVIHDENDGGKRRLANVLGVAVDLGMHDLALEQAARSMGGAAKDVLMGVLFPDDRKAASTWWIVLDARQPEQPHLPRLRQIRSLLTDKAELRIDAEEFARLAADLDAASAKQPAAQRASLLKVLAETSLKLERIDLALDYFQRAARITPSIALQAGDLLAEQQRFAEAAQWYANAGAAGGDSVSLYLEGWALDKAGETKSGRAKMQLAKALPLGASKPRHDFAKALKARDLHEAAAEQWELLVRTGDFREWYANDAAKELGNAASGKHNALSAAYWDRLALSGLKRSSAFTEVTSYLQLPYLVHKARARAHFDDGDPYAAAQEVWLAHDVLPANANMVEEFAPQLEKHGLNELADELFERVYARHHQICSTFPDSALHMNNLAWMCAQANRRLDDALRYAKQATELAPEKAMYIDTLAEVYFRRGDRRQAIQFARRCVQLEPGDEHFQKQLKRFQEETPP